MAKFELKLPKMGESVAEATITSWLKNVGDTIEIDDVVLEIATDKVDSEVPSDVDGVLIERFFNIDDVVQVGQVLAIIETEGEGRNIASNDDEVSVEIEENKRDAILHVEKTIVKARETVAPVTSKGDRFYSPLVKNIAKAEGVSQEELDGIHGSGKGNRVTKSDILDFIQNKKDNSKSIINKLVTTKVEPKEEETFVVDTPPKIIEVIKTEKTTIPVSCEDEVVDMTRMGKLVANHMMESIQTSAHVQSFIEADVTNLWNWRKKVKADFVEREGENLTFTPIFMEAIAKSLRDYPMMNISLQGDTIIKKKDINLGMAAALPDGNLIVPVIKNADQLNLVGMAKQVNDLANRARNGKLKPDDTQGGTYTVTNVGTFGSIMGTPIINQPQVGILALGAIRKVPAVIETSNGDFIGIRYKMFLSHSYDHRVVNGALGGLFVKAVTDYLEAWDINREI